MTVTGNGKLDQWAEHSMAAVAAAAEAAALELLEAARSLATMPGDDVNAEYDRAIVELTASVLGLSNLYADQPETVATLILGRTPNR